MSAHQKLRVAVMATILDLYREVKAVASRASTRSRAVANVRSLFGRLGLLANPFGDGDRKTAACGTYRPVGVTCPSTCPLLGNGCYAQENKVHYAARRAEESLLRSALSILACAVISGVWGERFRLHVSGDFGRDDAIDPDYVWIVGAIVSLVRDDLDLDRVLAWTYTHFPRDSFEPHRLYLESCGVSVLYSDRIEVGGAIVHPHHDLPRLRRESGVKIAKCIAQIKRGVTCQDCGLCWTARDRGIAIAFDPHGNQRKRLAESALSI